MREHNKRIWHLIHPTRIQNVNLLNHLKMTRLPYFVNQLCTLLPCLLRFRLSNLKEMQSKLHNVCSSYENRDTNYLRILHLHSDKTSTRILNIIETFYLPSSDFFSPGMRSNIPKHAILFIVQYAPPTLKCSVKQYPIESSYLDFSRDITYEK